MKTEPSLKAKINFRQYAYETLLEMALNFYGLESRWLDEAEKAESLSYILNALDEWENQEKDEKRHFRCQGGPGEMAWQR